MSDPRQPIHGAHGAPDAGGFYAGLVRRPIALSLVLLTLCVAGAIAWMRIPIQMFPAGLYEPEIGVWVPTPGSTARENEDKVARPIEEALRTLSGVSQIRSRSEDDHTSVRVSFVASMDMDLAKAEVRDRIERVRGQLPDTIDRLELWTEDADQMPVVWFGILYSEESAETDRLLDEVVRPRIEAVNGISRLEIWGQLDDSVRILLDEERVIAGGLDVGGLIRRLSSDNFAFPLGEIEDGGRRVLLRSDMRFTTPAEVAAYPIGAGLTIGDVAEVRHVQSVRDQISRIDGQYAYFGTATKESQANVVDVCRRVKAEIESLSEHPEVAGRLRFLVFGTQGEIVESSMDQLRGSAEIGGWLAVAVLLVFLRRVRLTLCVAASIPISVLLAVAWEHFAGASFNLFTMMGLTLALGMLVDNSIVVIENIARLRALGEPPLAAAAAGTREIALAVTLSTLTTIVVFMPLVFMTEHPILKAAFAGIGRPLTTSLLFSLLVALVFMPVAAARLQGHRPRWLERLGTALAPVAGLPVRGALALAAGARSLGRAAKRGALSLARALVAVLAPLRWPLALAAVAACAWAAWRARPGMALLEQALSGASGGAGSSLAGPIAATLFVLAAAAIGLKRWRRMLAPTTGSPGSPESPRSTGAPRASSAPSPQGGAADAVPRDAIGLLAWINRQLLAWTLEHRLAASLIGLALCASVAVPLSQMDFQAFAQDQSTDYVEFEVDFESYGTLAEADAQMLPYEQHLDRIQEAWGFDHTSMFFDGSGGQVSLYWDDRQPPSRLQELERELARELPRIPGHRLAFWNTDVEQTQDKRVVEYILNGPDSEVLAALGTEAAEILERVPGLSEVTTPLSAAPDEVRVEIDRDKAHDLGIQPSIAEETIAWALRGFMFSRFHDRGREIPFLIEFDEDSTKGLATLRDLDVWSGQAPVELASFAALSFEPGSQQIRRVNGRTSFRIQAQVDDPARLSEIDARARRELASLELPRGYEVSNEDSTARRQQEEFGELGSALILALVLVFLLMGILFESVLLPFSVLFTIPFAAVGAIWCLFIVGTPLDSVGMIGVIILGGVVVNNGIVLIDRFHRLRVEGEERTRAILDGCGQRLRPVLMTALTTIFGLVPTTLEEPTSNAIDYRGLALVVAGGLAVSTVFTLWAVPLAYTLIEDATEAVRAHLSWALRRRARTPATAAGANPAPAEA